MTLFCTPRSPEDTTHGPKGTIREPKRSYEPLTSDPTYFRNATDVSRAANELVAYGLASEHDFQELWKRCDTQSSEQTVLTLDRMRRGLYNESCRGKMAACRALPPERKAIEAARTKMWYYFRQLSFEDRIAFAKKHSQPEALEKLLKNETAKMSK